MHFSSRVLSISSHADYDAMLYSTAAAVAPAGRSIFSKAGGLCLFAYMAPVFTTCFRRSRTRVHKETRADALLGAPLHHCRSSSRRRSPVPGGRDRTRKGRPHFRDIAEPAVALLHLFLPLVSYSWG